MEQDKPTIKQEISSGDSSHNHQAGRDMTVHNHAPVPPRVTLIHVPTNRQIVEFDPNTRDVLWAAREIPRLRSRLGDTTSRSLVGPITIITAVITGIIMGFWLYTLLAGS